MRSFDNDVTVGTKTLRDNLLKASTIVSVAIFIPYDSIFPQII